MQSNEYVTFPDKVHYASGVLFRTHDTDDHLTVSTARFITIIIVIGNHLK